MARSLNSLSNEIVNFGANVRFLPAQILRPASENEVLEILDEHQGSKIRAIGSLHSWSENQKTSGIVLVLSELDSVEVDLESQTATVGAGCQVKRLLSILHKHNLTLPSVGLIDEQTVAGATATGTHGSGKHCLSHFIRSATIAHYDSETGKPQLTVVDSGAELQAAQCSLGLMGVIVSLTFQVRDRYRIEEHAAGHNTLEAVLAKEAEYPQQQFYLLPWAWRYLGHHRVESEKKRSFLASIYRWYCFLVIDVGLHIAIVLFAKVLRWRWLTRFFYKWILPLTVIRGWKVVDNSSDMLVMEHELFRHIEIEVFVQRPVLKDATKFLVDLLSLLGDKRHKPSQSSIKIFKDAGQWDQAQRLKGCYQHHYPICYRRVLTDDTLISMTCPGSHGEEDWFAISLISYQRADDRATFESFAGLVAATFANAFDGRCHWGKFNPHDKETIARLFPALAEFNQVVAEFDKTGAFRNDWLRELI